jgi:hypothetical protein
MRICKSLLVLLLVLLVGLLSGCSVIQSFSPTQTPTVTMTATAIPPTSTPTVTPTVTPIPFFLNASVLSGDINAPILLYHRFIPDTEDKSTATKTRFSDFKKQLQVLYDNGFSLISLKDWLDGSFVVPEGKRPLIITLDDLWFADQLYINDDGTPSIDSGLGILWDFSKSHPDFGFSASVFSNMGDKFYADKQVGERFILGDGDAWKDKLANTIAWAIENGVDPYNHLYTHPQLSLTMPQEIQYQLSENDRVTRYFLSRIGRDDLIPLLGNIIALPFGEWPSTPSGINVLKNYKTPERVPVAAIMEAYNLDSAELTPSVFSANFDRYRLPRITASDYMIQFVIGHIEEIPISTPCKLGPLEESNSKDLETIIILIDQAISSGTCQPGIYHVSGSIFDGRTNPATLYRSADGAISPTPTLTSTP